MEFGNTLFLLDFEKNPKCVEIKIIPTFLFIHLTFV
jgi:hypothetical protein